MRIFTIAGIMLFAGLGSALAAGVNDGWALIQTQYNAREHICTIGSGSSAGMSGRQAVYLVGQVNWRCGELERYLPLRAWRGKRLLVTLRLKAEGIGGANAQIRVFEEPHGGGVLTAWQSNARGSGEWEDRQFVVDVPDNATTLKLAVGGHKGEGKLWVDDLRLTAVGPEVPVTVLRQFQDGGMIYW